MVLQGTSVPEDEIVEPIIILLVYVVAFIVTLICNNWYLTWKTGVALIIQQLVYTVSTLANVGSCSSMRVLQQRPVHCMAHSSLRP